MLDTNENCQQGWELIRQGKGKDAIEFFRKATALDPANVKAWQGYGATLALLAKFQEALKAFDKVIELDPNNAQAWNNKGISLGSLDKHEEALEALDKALSFKPDYPEALSAKAYGLTKLSRYKEALKIAEKALFLDRNRANAWYTKGIALGRLNRNIEALEAFMMWANGQRQAHTSNIDKLKQAMDIVGSFIGWAWLEDPRKRKLKPELRHTLIRYWDGALQAVAQGNSPIVNSEDAACIMTLASCMVICPEMSGFHAKETRHKLMEAGEFEHEFFMLRVVDWYKRLTRNVEFHPPPGHDITISIEESLVHIECKTKRPASEKDIIVEEVWEKMYELMNRAMDKAGVNAIVYVDSTIDPLVEDIGGLIAVFRTLLNEGRSVTTKLNNKYRITITLTPPLGEPIKTAGFRWRPWGQFERGTSAVKVTKDGPQWWDVRHFFFNSREDRDYMKRVLYSFSEAKKQLPKEGSGVIHIEVVQPSGKTTISNRLEELKRRLSRELKGNLNRRVNAVVLSCTHFKPPEGLATDFTSVFHTNPRTLLPTGFHVAGTREDSEDKKVLPLNF